MLVPNKPAMIHSQASDVHASYDAWFRTSRAALSSDLRPVMSTPKEDIIASWKAADLDLEHPRPEQGTVLHRAIAERRVATALALLDAGANPNAQIPSGPREGYRPLDLLRSNQVTTRAYAAYDLGDVRFWLQSALLVRGASVTVAPGRPLFGGTDSPLIDWVEALGDNLRVEELLVKFLITPARWSEWCQKEPMALGAPRSAWDVLSARAQEDAACARVWRQVNALGQQHALEDQTPRLRPGLSGPRL